MNYDTIKEFEALQQEYMGLPGHKKLRSIIRVDDKKKRNLPKYSFIVDKFNLEDNIVDVGCGGSYFKGIFPNLIAFDMVDYGNQDYVCNIFDAPIPEGSQDGVFCFGVLHECPDEYHLPNIEKMLTWLKPNGQLVMRCKSKLVVNKHPVQRHAISILHEKYLDQGLWNRERIDQFTQQLNLKINWIKHRVVNRKQQWTNIEGANFDPCYDNDIVFNGYIWSWSKSV